MARLALLEKAAAQREVRFFRLYTDIIPTSGSLVGLSITYLVGEEEYTDDTADAGLRVVVHTQQEPIFPDMFGFNIASGYQASVTMTRVNGG